MIPVRAAIYARVSSDQQATDSTIRSQMAALEARLAQDGLSLTPDERFFDEGYSGATLVRPALERLRDTVAAGRLDRVYVHSPDRLARRYAYQVLLIDEFRRAGVEIVFLNRSIGLSPEDDLLLQVQGMVAEYERAKILERSRRGKRHAARGGEVSVLSGAPYGYRYVGKHAGGGVARYEVQEDEARIVRQIFQWIGRERVSIGEVCRRLRAQSCPTRSGKPSWDRSTVWSILKNPAYVGTAAFGKTRVGPRPARLRPVRGGVEQPRRAHGVCDVAPHEWIGVPVPPLVDAMLAEAAGEQLAENRRRNRQNARGQRYLLQGLVVCRQCGYAYYGKAISLASAKGQRRSYAYYRCCGSDAYRFGGERLCTNRQVRTDRLDEAVWREVVRVLEDPNWIVAEYERRLVRDQNPVASNLAGLESQTAKLRRSLDRLIDGYAESLIDKTEFEPRAAGLRQRLRDWEEQAARLRDEAAQRAALSLIVGRLEDFAQQVRQQMAAVDWSVQRDLIRLLVKRVEIDREEVNVVLRVTRSPADPGWPQPNTEHILHHCGRSERAALRRTGRCRFPGAQFDGAGLQPAPDRGGEHQQPRQQRLMADVVEATGDVAVEQPSAHPGRRQGRVKGDDRVHRAPSGSEPVAVRLKARLPLGFQRQFDEHLQGPVPDRWNAQRPSPSVRLRNIYASDWLGSVALEAQTSGQPRPALRRPAHHAINAGRISTCVLLGHPANRKPLRGN
jgi:site-specific DNA recombinase